MKNKFVNLAIFALLISGLISGCSGHKIDDPLIIPPHFNDSPDLNNIDKPNSKSSDQDLKDLKNLLLK
jgi:hypothetical protein